MARDTQDKFTALLNQLAEDHGFELIQDRQWANTGIYRIESATAFEPVLSVHYGFHDGYATFSEVVPAIADRENGTRWPHVTPDELGTRVLATIKTYLAAQVDKAKAS